MSARDDYPDWSTATDYEAAMDEIDRLRRQRDDLNDSCDNASDALNECREKLALYVDLPHPLQPGLAEP